MKSFSWYAWDIWDYGDDILGPWVTLVEPGRPSRPSDAGIAYGEIAKWLIGSSMQDLTIDGGVWRVTLKLVDGSNAWIVWRAGPGGRVFDVPSRVTTVHELDGTERPWRDPTYVPMRRPVMFR